MELDEKWLMGAAGWQVVKEARRLLDNGLVTAASRPEADLFQGAVASGRRPIACGLRIRSRTDVDNLCHCPTARRTGAICEHSAAIFLAVLRGMTGKASKPAPAPTSRAPSGGTRRESPTIQRTDGESPETPIPKELLRPLNIELPQDIAEFWEKNRIVCRVAPDRGRGRAAESGDASAASLNSDLARWLADHGIRSCPAVLSLDQSQASELFALLREDEALLVARSARGASGHFSPLVVADVPIRRRLILEPLGSDDHPDAPSPEDIAKRRFRCRIEPPPGTVHLAAAAPPARTWFFRPDPPTLFPSESASAEIEAMLASAGRGGPLTLGWLATHLDSLGQAFTLDGDRPIGGFAIESGRPVPILSVEGSLNHLAAQVAFDYHGTRLPSTDPREDANPSAPALVAIDRQRRTIMARNSRAETTALTALATLGFKVSNRDSQLSLNGEERILRFFSSGIERLREAGWKVELGERFARLTAGIERVRPQLDHASLSSANNAAADWFEATLDFSTSSGYHVPQAEIQRLLRSGSCRTRTPDGKLVVVDLDAAEAFTELLAESDVRTLGASAGGGARVAIPMRSAASLSAATGQAHELEALLAIPREEVEKHFTKIPENVRALLRDYQAEGVRWMIRLALAGFGGVLGDEMGLGKTLQVLAFIAAMRMVGDREEEAAAAGRGRQPVLVVAPTSLLGTWDAEAARFFPALRRRIHHGAERRSLGDGLEDLDLLITSYGLLASEHAAFSAQGFPIAVLDEASMIRNPDTATARAARALPAPVRFALTGTPVENSLSDAWSLFEFVAPGYLGSRPEFRERYEKPLSLPSPPAGTAARLRRRLAPYLLRRKKDDVLSELPERIEETIHCPLSARQQEVYRRLLDESREGIRHALRTSGAGGGQARMTMLTALLRLRQVCCDLRLLGLADDEASGSEEGKLAAFRELTREAVEGGHRVLVFSQFTGMLKLLRETLEKSGLESCYLDGATRDRSAVVRRFQEGDSPLFLISLKAGGYGLTLTEADTVVLYDPWWNPAVEAQAIDRAHRIGQRRMVTAYRLIAKGTVEEKILALQATKRGLFDAALDDERPLMRGLSDDELRGLLDLDLP